MKVTFTFTDSPRGARELHHLTGVVYSIYDHENNLILVGEGGIHELQPGKYCVYGSKYYDEEKIYFGQEPFTVPEEAPEPPFPIWPPPQYDINVFVYMELILIEDKEETPCPELWPEDNGDGGWLWVILILLLIGGMS